MRSLSPLRLNFFSILMLIEEYIKRFKWLLRFILTPFKGSEVNACSLFES